MNVNRPLFTAAELVAGPPEYMKQVTSRFFVQETYMTSDGPRTRVTEGRYKTLEEAQAAVETLTNKHTKVPF
jgi:hypothetical protein